MPRGFVTLQTALRLLRAQLHGDAQNLIDDTIAELDRLEYIEAAAAAIADGVTKGYFDGHTLDMLFDKIREGPRAGELLP